MLRELRIRNLAVVDSVTVPFAPGLNVLTGETGAGKSILIDAILLVRGGRAQADVIRADADSATVEAVFAVEPKSAAAAVLDEAGLAPDDGEILIRRELSRNGRHRAFVNDSPVTVGLLERLGDELIEVHGQHEHQRLLEPARQMALLDRFAEAHVSAEHVATLYAGHREARESVERLRAAERDRAQREDLLRFQVSELDAARLVPGEEEALRLERRRLQHAERFATGVAEVVALLDDDRESASARLARAERVLHDLGRLDAPFAEPASPIATARLHLDEALAGVRALRDAIVFDPARLAEIDDRLDALARLRRKYGDTEETMLCFRHEAAAELDRLARHDEVLAREEARAASLARELLAAAAALTEARREAARRLGGRVERQLRGLGMEHARFEIGVEPLADGLVSAHGVDRVEFRLSANPDEPPKPLARIASGGELSRAMLAVKAVLARNDGVPVLVFDEVDAGIGGRVAGAVARALVAAAAGRQVLCVTHLAPIAAEAAHQVRVAKTARGGRTRVAAAPLAGDERVAEIARMLGGDESARTALGHARTLLRDAAR